MPEKEEWYRNWFDSPYYDLLYKDRDQEEADMFIHNLIRHLAPAKNAAMLDLACGKGRYSVALHRMGFNVTGIDLSRRKIDLARENLTQGLSFLVHDMRAPMEANQYDYIFNLFTSFGYFEDEDENKVVLTNAFNSLKSGSIFVLDYFNGEKAAKYLMRYEEYTIEEIDFSISKYIKNNQLVKDIQVKDGVVESNFSEKVSIFSEATLKKYITDCGFEISEIFGDYQLNPFSSEDSERLIIISRKP